MNWRILPHVLCPPFISGLFYVGFMWFWAGWSYTDSAPGPPEFLLYPILFAYYFIPSGGSIFYLSFSQLAIVNAWMKYPQNGIPDSL